MGHSHVRSPGRNRGHSHRHGHGHGHGLTGPGTATGRHRRRLFWVVGITLAVVAVQVAGAILSGSLALLADAGHMLSDAAGVSIALLAAWIATRPASDRRTYGYQRAEVLAALANAALLVVIAVVIFLEALRRFNAVPQIHTGTMLLAAVLGAAANLVCLLILRGGQAESLNVRGAYLEVLGDLLGSLAVIAAAVVITLTGFRQADAIASILIAVMILPRAWSLLRDVVNVLLEATPKGVDVASVREHIQAAAGVVDVHDIHIWTITSGVPVFSAHVVVEDEALNADGLDRVLDRLSSCLGDHFDTAHCTFQVEPASHAVHETRHHD
ncbi:cation diffusion facilitator family transporter [Arthrobacter mobilis]|uniref:Cation transporter n=1 Tax=Arthrobacter mobilis TaxID=2724944 RepID=A0A7X6K6A9_9MICC|nr:cation diffusion facilitator family transporter [Arthrobacter mobilis]NKX55025.1 cation transporter [Arthrobacter mobilis]